jgi:hypothetical protein
MKNIKTTKKSMFAVTLLIVVLLIAAVATATYAWFTVQTSVTATGALVTTATAEGANLSIGWDRTTAESGVGFRIDFEDVTGGLNPMALTSLLASATPETNFWRSNVANNLLANPQIADAARLSERGVGTADAFFLANTDTAQNFSAVAINAVIAPVVLVEGEGTHNLTGQALIDQNADNVIAAALTRVAVYTRVAGSTDDFALVGIFASVNEATTVVMAMPTNSTTPQAEGTNDSARTSHNITGGLAAGATLEVVVVAWFDGYLLQNHNAGGSATITLNFVGTPQV